MPITEDAFNISTTIWMTISAMNVHFITQAIQTEKIKILTINNQQSTVDNLQSTIGRQWLWVLKAMVISFEVVNSACFFGYGLLWMLQYIPVFSGRQIS